MKSIFFYHANDTQATESEKLIFFQKTILWCVLFSKKFILVSKKAIFFLCII